jgi:PelA/Pel-15E family pectate lyase
MARAPRLAALTFAAVLVGGAACAPAPDDDAAASPSAAGLREEVLATMRTATTFMTDDVAYQGGYLWSYLPDGSRQFGEMEAYPTQIWIQPPGTATMGHVYLDAFHATGDEAYYDAAVEVGEALMAAQHPAGGWNYLHDFAGEESLQRWYDTIGRNGWRLEEFQHHDGSATFDDAGTAESSQLLLRLYLEQEDPAFRPALDRAVAFVLDSQYPVGGWPQRFPLAPGTPEYARDITFNDDVAAENIELLLMVHQALGDDAVLPAVRAAMDAFVVTQQPAPQAGWSLQHDAEDLRPVGARSYEPESLATHTTAGNVEKLLGFYELTGDDRYLAGVPAALDWLDSVRLPEELWTQDGRQFPTFVELGTNDALFVHRTGSDVVNGRYWADKDPAGTIVHYSSFRAIDVPALRERYETLLALPVEEVTAGSPLLHRGAELPEYFSTGDVSVSDLNVGTLHRTGEVPTDDEVREIVAALDAEGYWPTLLVSTSNPYTGDGSPTPAEGDFSQTEVGGPTDTSPYTTDDPVTGISTGRYIEHMSTLLRWVAEA